MGDECTRYRQAFDECRDEAWADQHRRTCDACDGWAVQSTQLMDLASQMPQFDVPEALTQRILNAVDLEKNVSARAVPIYVWPSAALLGGLCLTALPYESVEGVVSWAVGIAALGIVKFLVCNGKASSEQPAS